MVRCGRIICLFMLTFAPALRCFADAIVVTRAMTATTIAEVFIEEGSARVELEIGVTDLGGFRNLMPDDLYERMGNAPEPLEDRLRRFFAEDFVVRAEGADPIVGELRQIVPRQRTRRDEITGEPWRRGRSRCPKRRGGEVPVVTTERHSVPVCGHYAKRPQGQ